MATSITPESAPNSEGKAPSERLHLDYLDGIRALAAIYVILGHAHLQVFPFFLSKQPTPLVKGLTFWVEFGHFAVSLFIVISGFCLMLPVVRNRGEIKGGISTFFKRRAKRILPPYYLSVGLSLLLIVLLVGQKTQTHWDLSIPVTLRGLISHLLLYQNWEPFDVLPQINHAHWSIAVECQIYLFFPLLVLLWKKIGAVRVTLLTTILSYAIAIPFYKVPDFRFVLACPHYLGLFSMGMLGATIAHDPDLKWQRWRENRFWTPLALLMALGLVLGNILGGEAAFANEHWFDLVAGIGGMCLLIGAGQPGKNRVRRFLSWRPLVFVGGFSYSIYLIHAPLLQIVWQYLLSPFRSNDGLNLFMLLVPGTALIVAISYLFYLACERPFLNARR